MGTNLLCDNCEKLIFCDYKEHELIEETFCKLLKEKNPDCKKCNIKEELWQKEN